MKRLQSTVIVMVTKRCRLQVADVTGFCFQTGCILEPKSGTKFDFANGTKKNLALLQWKLSEWFLKVIWQSANIETCTCTSGTITVHSCQDTNKIYILLTWAYSLTKLNKQTKQNSSIVFPSHLCMPRECFIELFHKKRYMRQSPGPDTEGKAHDCTFYIKYECWNYYC